MLVRSIALTLLLAGCVTHPLAPTPHAPLAWRPVELFDTTRQRPVPVVLYGAARARRPKPLAIISHGYGGHSTDYTFIASALARRGYIVASIEHLERSGDPRMANSGNLVELRRPVWQIGADSIGFVISELRRRGLADHTRVVLVGHSNGGDMTMLFSSQHRGDVQAAFSLDHRRMPVPRTARPRICSARSNDYAADPGVLPVAAERDALGMVMAEVPVKHNDMLDSASPQQQQAILEVLAACLDGHLVKQHS
ncbi:putative dienelactone hydrolase [Polymorphobacter multimanifer]|uniref:Putative dienelactone hydrolase n=1 Tax=Polymorphobacter multimanifer TaxID=1070431 RepID=A0A841LIT6_9SPHN|nr:alpha/beta hydrolase [Polymorphobacter multimanifer]MBB6229142.1 putative dienelactone hydrolase [Polymorphobacter multimanifer]